MPGDQAEGNLKESNQTELEDPNSNCFRNVLTNTERYMQIISYESVSFL